MPAKRKASPAKDLAGPLRVAAEQGDLARVQELLSAGANPDRREPQQTTALIAAARAGHLEVIKVLLAAGANPSFADGGKRGTTGLLEAVRHRHLEAAMLLADAGADFHHDWSAEGDTITCEVLDARNNLFEKAQKVRSQHVWFKRAAAPEAERAKAERALPISFELARKALVAGGKAKARHLHQAAASGDRELIHLLLAHGTDVNGKFEAGPFDFGETALNYAVSNYQTETVRDLLKAGADTTISSLAFGPPLHLAVAEGMTDIVSAFVEAKAPLNLSANVPFGPRVEGKQRSEAVGSTPLIVAVRAGHSELARLLVEGGADLTATDRDGLTALAWAKRLEKNDLVQLFGDAGAEDSKNTGGSAFHRLMRAAAAGDLAAVREAVAAGADANGWEKAERTGKSPLMAAAEHGHAEIISELLQAGADANGAGADESSAAGITPLMLAAKNGHAAAVEVLLKAGAQIEARQINLFELAVDPEARRSPFGDSALHLASRGGHTAIVRLLINAGAKSADWSRWSGTALAAAAESGDALTIEVLLEAGANPNPRPTNSGTPLVIAAGSGSEDSVRLLLKHGAKPNVFSKFGDSAIGNAAAKGNLATVQLLLDSSANPNGASKTMRSPLSLASFNGHLEIARLLVTAGANVNHRNADETTPLHQGAIGGHPQMIELLLESGADPTATCMEGHTPLDDAETALRQGELLKEEPGVLERRKKVVALLNKGKPEG